MEDEKGKICPNCGEVLPGDSLFCVKCGTKIEENPQKPKIIQTVWGKGYRLG